MREVNESQNPFAPPATETADEVTSDAPALFGGGARSAGLGARLGAAAIDTVLVYFSALAVQTVFGFSFLQFYSDVEVLGWFSWLVMSLAFYLVLNGYLLARHGPSIGKRALDIRIVNASDGRTASFTRIVLLRLVPYYVVALLPDVGPYAVLLDVLTILRKDRRCIHDLIAGTRVVGVE